MYFEFNGKSSINFGIQINRIEDNDDFGVSRTINKSSKNRYRYRANHYGTQYDNDLTFTITVMKNVCNTPSDNLEFTSDDIRKINAWLTSPQLPQLLKIKDDRYFDEEIFFFAIFKGVRSVSQIRNPIELSFEVECDSPFGYSDIYEHNISATTTIPSKITIVNTSDEQEHPIYPLFEITPTSHMDITIENITDGKSITLKGLVNNKITLDSQYTILKDEAGNLVSYEDIGITEAENIYYPRLLYGENKFKITGGCSIKITYREPRKVGAF